MFVFEIIQLQVNLTTLYFSEKLTKEHDQKRAERAKAREEMRKKHCLKSSESDQQILKESEALPWVKINEKEDDFISEATTKLKSAWDSFVNFF